MYHEATEYGFYKEVDKTIENVIQKIERAQDKLKQIAQELEKEPSNTRRLGKEWVNYCISSGTLRESDIFAAVEHFLPLPLRIDFILAKDRLEKDMIYEEILDFMDNIAPEGCYFGSLEEDGACIGFWEGEK